MEIANINYRVQPQWQSTSPFPKTKSMDAPPAQPNGNSPVDDKKLVMAKGEENAHDLKRELEALAVKLQETLKAMNFSLQFMVNAETNRVTIRVMDEKGKVIREIPPEEQIRLAENLTDVIALVSHPKVE